MRFRYFDDNSRFSLERKVNDWLEDNPNIEIINFSSNGYGVYATTRYYASILYKDAET